jgi:hypothetical protein
MDDDPELLALVERHTELLVKRIEAANALNVELQAITEEINAICEALEVRMKGMQARERVPPPFADSAIGPRPPPPRSGTGVMLPKRSVR